MKKILLAIALLLISGCSTVKPLEVFNTSVEKTPLNLKDPDPITLESINWKIISEENSEEIYKELKANNIDPVLIGLTDNDYEKLSINMEKLRGYIIRLQFILNKYRNYYEDNVDGSRPES